LSTKKSIREARRAKQAGIPAEHVFGLTRDMLRDQRKPAKASTPARQAPNPKGK